MSLLRAAATALVVAVVLALVAPRPSSAQSGSVCGANPSPPRTADPSVHVTSPVAGDRVDSPFQVQGQARVFEGTLTIDVRDAAGNVMVSGSAQAARGAATVADFTATIGYVMASDTPVCLWVYQASARDGRPVDVVQVPLTLRATPETVGAPLRQVDWNAVLRTEPSVHVGGNDCLPAGFAGGDGLCITATVFPPAAADGPGDGGPAATFSGYAFTGPSGVLYGDIDGDGVEEAVIRTISGGTGGSFGFLVYHLGSPRPRLVAAFPGYKLEVQIRSGTLVVSQPFYFGFEPNCCPVAAMETGYRLAGNVLVPVYGPVYSLTGSATGGQAASPEEITVAAFYRALSQGAYRDAYALLSGRFQADNRFDAWIAGYSTTQSIDVVVGPGDAPGEVTVLLTAMDGSPSGGTRTRAFQGSWFTVPDPSAPLGVRLDRATIRAVE